MTVRTRLGSADGHRVLILGASVLSYAPILQLAYPYRASPYFAVQGLTYRTPKLSRYALALFLVPVLARNLIRQSTRRSDFMQWLPFILAGVPNILLPEYMESRSPAEAHRWARAIASRLLLCRALTTTGLSVGRIAPRPSPHVWKISVVAAAAIYPYTAIVAGTLVPRLVPRLTVSSANLFMSLLTQGLGILVVVLLFLRRDGWESRSVTVSRGLSTLPRTLFLLGRRDERP